MVNGGGEWRCCLDGRLRTRDVDRKSILAQIRRRYTASKLPESVYDVAQRAERPVNVLSFGELLTGYLGLLYPFRAGQVDEKQHRLAFARLAPLRHLGLGLSPGARAGVAIALPSSASVRVRGRWCGLGVRVGDGGESVRPRGASVHFVAAHASARRGRLQDLCGLARVGDQGKGRGS